MSRQTEDALHDAICAHLEQEGIMKEGEIIVGWVCMATAELPSDAESARYGWASPLSQRFHVTHGLVHNVWCQLNKEATE